MIFLLQNPKQEQHLEEIKKQIAEAPDSSYEIGLFIGNLLPFVVLALLAYLLYSYMKNRAGKDNEMLD
ncbi:hypothetical protein [Capnocytophaga canimorsus]|uniref:hypothetical protein n=1 Tax=Capnocytophaga canimorsus TaxID=28188 RepID=UPI000D6E39E1|nr:hypothetical protein [Capnocytophaga canimorsus]AWL77795.1 hypothetical protein DKB58_01870 [Capnocytophaga canimorsus]AYW36401.1 hypothetical protein D8L92_03130 [Capnocytophaga canimorsus]MDT9500439.1 hypothetical protein [Capnocytophaga canimorsus]